MAIELMTVAELRDLLARLPDDAPILVEGYEGGYDRPLLVPIQIDPEPYQGGGGVYGVWADIAPLAWPRSECANPIDAWALTRAVEEDEN